MRQNPLGLANYSLYILGPSQLKLKVGVREPQTPNLKDNLHKTLQSPSEPNLLLRKEGKIIRWKNVSSTRLQTWTPPVLVCSESSQRAELLPEYPLWEGLVQPELPLSCCSHTLRNKPSTEIRGKSVSAEIQLPTPLCVSMLCAHRRGGPSWPVGPGAASFPSMCMQRSHFRDALWGVFDQGAGSMGCSCPCSQIQLLKCLGENKGMKVLGYLLWSHSLFGFLFGIISRRSLSFISISLPFSSPGRWKPGANAHGQKEQNCTSGSCCHQAIHHLFPPCSKPRF